MRTWIVFLAFPFLFGAFAAFADTVELVDFGSTTAADWRIISDGYAVPAGEMPTAIRYGVDRTTYRETKKVMGIRFSVPAVYHPSCVILKPLKEFAAGNDITVLSLELGIKGFNWAIDAAVMAEDRDGRPYELFLATLDIDRWRRFALSFPLEDIKMRGFVFKGLIFYPREEYRDHTRDRILYLENLTLSYFTDGY